MQLLPVVRLPQILCSPSHAADTVLYYASVIPGAQVPSCCPKILKAIVDNGTAAKRELGVQTPARPPARLAPIEKNASSTSSVSARPQLLKSHFARVSESHTVTAITAEHPTAPLTPNQEDKDPSFSSGDARIQAYCKACIPPPITPYKPHA
ncbi:hypothetical protein Q7P37_007770 [Cladosporium fusiforme]